MSNSHLGAEVHIGSGSGSLDAGSIIENLWCWFPCVVSSIVLQSIDAQRLMNFSQSDLYSTLHGYTGIVDMRKCFLHGVNNFLFALCQFFLFALQCIVSIIL